jgi:hypothetical protein
LIDSDFVYLVIDSGLKERNHYISGDGGGNKRLYLCWCCRPKKEFFEHLPESREEILMDKEMNSRILECP